jgi:hypothetical protein
MTVDSRVLGQMQVFVTISSKVNFIQKTMSVSLHKMTRASMGSFPAAFIAPYRNREYPDTFLHSVEVVTCTHKRSKPCCTSELKHRPHFLGMGPSRWSKPITILLCDPAYPPFCNPLHHSWLSWNNYGARSQLSLNNVTSQEFIKFWGKFYAFVLLVLIEISQEFKTFWVYLKTLLENYFKLSIISWRTPLRKNQISKCYFLSFIQTYASVLAKEWITKVLYLLKVVSFKTMMKIDLQLLLYKILFSYFQGLFSKP